MPDPNILPVLVVAQSQNNAEKLNGALRSAGYPVRSEWAASTEDATKALEKQVPDIIFCFSGLASFSLDQVIAFRDANCAQVPVIAISKSVEEDTATQAMASGARDLVSVDHTERLHAVVARELGNLQQRRELVEANRTIAEFQGRFDSFLKESGDAIAYVHEGIHVSANPAYLELFGFNTPEDIEGIPVMDLFAPSDQGKLKEALRSCAKTQQEDVLGDIKGVHADGNTFALAIELAPVEIDGDPCIEIAIRNEGTSRELEETVAQLEGDTSKLQKRIRELERRDLLTGLAHRQYFIHVMRKAHSQKAAGGTRALVYIKPDNFAAIKNKVGIIGSDKVIKTTSNLIRQLLEQGDIAGRFGGTMFAALVTRKEMQAVSEWAERLRSAISSHVFEAGGQSTGMTCSIGFTEFGPNEGDLETLIAQATQACREVRETGGNKVKMYQPAERDAEGQLSDAGWVKQIKEAIKNDDFLLLYQPIASLQGDDSEMYDVLVRMRDREGQEIMPGGFMPAASRNNLMGAIDRWIIENAIRVLAERTRERKRAQFFVRISDQTLLDKNIVAWVRKILQEVQTIPPGNLVFEVSESSAENHLKETKEFMTGVRQLKCGFALEHFGVGHSPMQMFEHLEMDYLKIDGSYMTVLSSDEVKRERVQTYIDTAKERSIETVAERVENADTMAVLWQMGVSYIQGNYVQEPEVVMAEGARLPM